MAQTPAERRKAQRRTARALRRGQNPLGGEFGEHSNVVLFGRSEAPDDEVHLTYVPTKTTWPENGWDHRRTDEAGYNRNTQTLRIQFHTNGAVYDYYDVPPAVARTFRRVESPGRYINAVLNGYEYSRVY